jgi:hypothetical protein
MFVGDIASFERIRNLLNQTFNKLKLEKHPKKTLIGRLDRGFDFLGYHFHPQGLTVAKKTLMRFVERATRLNEQERAGRVPPGSFGAYLIRWLRWAIARVCTQLVYGVNDSQPNLTACRCSIN